MGYLSSICMAPCEGILYCPLLLLMDQDVDDEMALKLKDMKMMVECYRKSMSETLTRYVHLLSVLAII